IAPTINAVGPFTFEENTLNFTPTPNGTQVVASISATDPGVNDTFSNWQIVSGNTDVDGDMMDAFAIDDMTGEITVQDADDLDFEQNPIFSLGVTVSDGTDTSAVETITINLTDILEGSARSERLRGSNAENDQIDGLDGNDRIYGYDGTDTLFGGNGRDYLYGGDDNDLLDGGDGNDVLDGQNDDDMVFGRDGNDIVRGGNGNDYLEGNNGNDKLYGFAGNDTLIGGDDVDTLYGGNDDDFLDGGLGNDYLYADQGIDTLLLQAGDGNDSIYTFDLSNDVFALGGGLMAADLSYTAVGLNTEISITATNEVLATLINTQTDGMGIATTVI
nr:hypothetical protein [Leptolyngbyaceae cyanobacterium MAG.088]